MPSNEKLIADIGVEAAKLGVEIVTEGKSNSVLVKLLSDTKAKAKDAELDTDADAAVEAKAKKAADKLAKAEAKAEADKPAKKTGYVVAPGKSICCTKRGVIAEGEEVKASDLGGGADALANHIEKKTVVKA